MHAKQKFTTAAIKKILFMKGLPLIWMETRTGPGKAGIEWLSWMDTLIIMDMRSIVKNVEVLSRISVELLPKLILESDSIPS